MEVITHPDPYTDCPTYRAAGTCDCSAGLLAECTLPLLEPEEVPLCPTCYRRSAANVGMEWTAALDGWVCPVCDGGGRS